MHLKQVLTKQLYYFVLTSLYSPELKSIKTLNCSLTNVFFLWQKEEMLVEQANLSPPTPLVQGLNLPLQICSRQSQFMR